MWACVRLHVHARNQPGTNVDFLGSDGEQTWDTTGAPGAAATLVCVCAAGWEVGGAWAWGVMTMGVCCEAVTATVGATGPFWKTKEETERQTGRDALLAARPQRTGGRRHGAPVTSGLLTSADIF